MSTIKLPSLMQIGLSFTLFLGLAFCATELFHIPIQLVLFGAWFIMIGLGVYLGHAYQDLEKAIIRGIEQGLIAVLILIAVGALVGTWIKGGIVPSVVYYGLYVIHPTIFLPACLIICALTSLVTGTSWGTVGTAGIAMMGIGSSMGLPAPLTAGAVLSGAYFGDKVSPMSDSVILASTLSRVDIIEHIKGMLPISLSGFLVAFIAFSAVGFFFVEPVSVAHIDHVRQALSQTFHINFITLTPIFITLILLGCKRHAFPIICFGALLGAVWAILQQGVDVVTAIQSIYAPEKIHTGMSNLDLLLNRGGIESMQTSIVIIIFGLGLGGILEEVGILTVITESLSQYITGAFSLVGATLFCAILANIFGSAMYVSLILTPKIMAYSYDKLGLHRKMLSRTTEFGGTLTSGMVPWSDNGIFMATMLGVSTLSYLPYMWLNMACIVIALVTSYMGWFTFYTEKNDNK